MSWSSGFQFVNVSIICKHFMLIRFWIFIHWTIVHSTSSDNCTSSASKPPHHQTTTSTPDPPITCLSIQAWNTRVSVSAMVLWLPRGCAALNARMSAREAPKVDCDWAVNTQWTAGRVISVSVTVKQERKKKVTVTHWRFFFLFWYGHRG